jgi:hypothetical protein
MNEKLELIDMGSASEETKEPGGFFFLDDLGFLFG